MKTILTALLCAGALSATHAAKPAAPPPPPGLQDFTWRQSLNVSGQEAAYRVSLPAVVYGGSGRSDLGDLRFFNGNGELLPYAFLPRSTPPLQPPQHLRLPHFPVTASTDAVSDMHIDLRADKEGRLSVLHVSSGAGTTTNRQATRAYVLDASALKQPIAALRLKWQAKDNIAVVNIEASDNLQDWRLLRSQAQLVDLRIGKERLLKDRIELNGVRSKYLRLSWNGESPVTLSAAEAEITAAGPMPMPMPLQWNGAKNVRAGEAAGEYFFDNPGLPVSKLRITLPQTNTVVPVRIFRRDNGKAAWREVAGTTLYRLLRQGQEIAFSDLAVASTRAASWRLLADMRGGGLGQGLPEISLGWTPQEMVFVARGNGPYTLAYGNAELTSAAYNITTLLPGYKDEQLAALPAAPANLPAPDPGKTAEETPADPVLRHKIVLWGVLLLGMAILALMAWRLLQQMNQKR